MFADLDESDSDNEKKDNNKQIDFLKVFTSIQEDLINKLSESKDILAHVMS